MFNMSILQGAHGVPILFQRMPEWIKSVDIRWIVFVGSADDMSVGEPGLFHWFEHIPFRGTVRYPNGLDTLAHFERHGGEINAHTAETHTAYIAHVRKQDWLAAFDLITDLVAQPLLRPADIEAEREIIYQEICDTMSNPMSWSMIQVHQQLWGDHPLAHAVCGTVESLNSMDNTTLQRAHQTAYDRSRCALIIAGNLDHNQVIEEANRRIEQLPAHDAPPRRQGHAFGALSLPPPGTQKTVAPFPVSGVFMVFPRPSLNEDRRALFRWSMLSALLDAGVAGPLNRILREERNLVYGAGTRAANFSDGGYLGFGTQTRRQAIGSVREALRDVLIDQQLHSSEWFEYVRDYLLAQREMQLPNPSTYAEMAEEQIVSLGYTISDDEAYNTIASLTQDEVLALLDVVKPDNAREFVFRGKQ